MFAWLCFVAPVAVAILGARSSPAATHDAATLRVLGLGFTGVFRALDAWLAAPFMALPLGTRAFRASLAVAVVCGLGAWLTFLLGEPLARGDGTKKPKSRLSHAVVALGVITAFASPPWQVEGSAVGGTATGATLVLLAAYLGLEEKPGAARLAFVIGCAFGWEPLVGAVALVAALVPLAFAGKKPSLPSRRRALRVVAAFALGLVPLALALATKGSPLTASRELFGAPLGETALARSSVRVFVRDDVGFLFGGAAAFGAYLTLANRETRARGAVLLVLTLGAPLARALDLSFGPVRYSAIVLVALAAAGAFAGSGLFELVRRVRAVKVPFAPASAALLVVLEWTLPVRAADDAFTRRQTLSKNAAHAFAVASLGPAPPAAIVLVSDPRVLERIQATRAAGLAREDIELFPTYDLKSTLARDAVDFEPKLAGLYRDLALGTLPEEWSLSALGAARPLLLTFDPKWKPSLAKHLVPDGLFSRFEPEPQGPSDRRLALEKAAKRRAFLTSEVAGPGRDVGLQRLVAHLLRARALGLGAIGERENLSKVLDELRPYAPDDPVASQLVRRTVTTRGAFEVSDLSP